MNNLINKIEISSFRSIEKLTVRAKEINVFSGSNDAGKSNILKALNLFFNNQTDFLKLLKFEDDYNKVSRAKAIRSTKTKQLIKIRVYIKPPKSYKSLFNIKDVYIERQFDRAGNKIEKHCSSNFKIVRAINTLINKVKYIYIPALKGEVVLQYLLSLIGERELVSEDNISTLNKSIEQKTSDLKEILESSGIQIGTTFGLPTLLSDFWQKLSVNTLYDEFYALETKIKGKNTRSLNPNQFNISLLNRGEGIKSKYIPPLLRWLDNNDSSKVFIWGIDEPENSLEFGLANELAKLFFNEYPKSNQIFITSHSLAFINPPSEIKFNPLVFKVFKDDLARTQIVDFETLYKQFEKEQLYSELGIFEAQKEFIDNYRRSIEEIDELKSKIDLYEQKVNEYNTNVLFVEGPSDKVIIEKALNIMKPDYKPNFSIEHSQKNGGGHEWVKDMLISWHYNRQKQSNKLKCIGIFDYDKGSKKSINEVNEIDNHKGIKVIKLDDYKPNHLINIFRKGIKIPFAIEEFFPSDIWRIVYDLNNEWFEEKKDIIEYNNYNELTKSFIEFCKEKGISENEELFMKKVKQDNKLDFCNYVCNGEYANKINFCGFQKLLEDLINQFA